MDNRQFTSPHQTPSSGVTLIEALIASLRSAAAYNSGDQVAPAAVLWPDGDRQWEELLPQLTAEADRQGIPLLTLGPYDPASGAGPAIWLRCFVDGAVAREKDEGRRMKDELPGPAALDNAEGGPPVLYLPGVSRADLRAVEECPLPLQPLAELQYRGVCWTHRNGKDWTVAAFLQNTDGGLGIPVAPDAATRDALRLALLKLAETPLETLRKDAPLTAAHLHSLLHPDEVFSLLRWLDDPEGFRAALPTNEWLAFRGACRDRFRFDPAADGPITAAGMLGDRREAWSLVWNRFAEAPERWKNLPALLRQGAPRGMGGLSGHPASWPQTNEQEEAALRGALAALKGAGPAEARATIRTQERLHADRRGWVWARLGQAPLAFALQALAELADATETALPGASPVDAAEAYVSGRWKADAALLDALAAASENPDVDAVKCAAHALYEPWLRSGAEAFAAAVGLYPLPTAPAEGPEPVPGKCLLFADGLRYDVAERLAALLSANGLKVDLKWRFGALPGVTPTAKPAASPLASHLKPGPGFQPTLENGQKVTAETLRSGLAECGYHCLAGDEANLPPDPPSGKGPAGWAEAGALDSYGHNYGWKLARRVGEEVQEMAGRIRALLDGGWSEVQVVTDHGWLLLPGGLPKADLPEHLTDGRKGRCARLKASSSYEGQTVPWRWDPSVRIAVAPGIRSFVAGKEYEHGGLSVQECVLPVLTIRSAARAAAAAIVEVKWRGLVCRVQVEGAGPGTRVDLRTKAGDPNSSLAHEVKLLGPDGRASLAALDDRVGDAVLVVALNGAGEVIAQSPTVVGGE